jgi:hypothetical protein
MAKQGKRPTELDSPKIDTLVNALRAGNYFEHACSFAGLAPSTVYRWLERGRKEQEAVSKGKDPNDDEGHYVELCNTIEKARAEAIVRNVGLIQKAANDGTWQAAAWWLERTMPQQFGRQIKAEVISIDNTSDIDADIERIAKFLDTLDESRALEMEEGTGEA